MAWVCTKLCRKNPYQLAEDVSGIGFRIADEIASRIGIHTDSDYRIRSGILYTLLQAGTEGHVFLPEEILLEKSAEMLGLKPEQIAPQITNLAIDRKLVIKEKSLEDNQKMKCIYGMTAYYAELNCARMLYELQQAFDGAERFTKVELDRLEKKDQEIGGGLSSGAGRPPAQGCDRSGAKWHLYPFRRTWNRKDDHDQHDYPLF